MSNRRVLAAAAIVVLLVLAFGASAILLPHWVVYRQRHGLTASELATYEASTRTAIATTLVAIAGGLTGFAALATYRASRTEERSRALLAVQSERAEVFSRSAGQFNQPTDVRVGAILSLQQLALSWDADAPLVYELLQVYVSVHSSQMAMVGDGRLVPTQPIDVKIALDCMRRIRRVNPSLPPFDTNRADVRGADLEGLVD